MNRAFVLWTGGKDSCLALHLARQAEYDIAALVTFVPGDADFKAHPLELMARQADSLGLQHLKLPVRPPYEEGYRNALLAASERLSAEVVITGDIDEVSGHPNWIAARCEETGLETFMPLWKRPRKEIFEKVFAEKIEARISYINDKRLPNDWVGKMIDQAFFQELKQASRKLGFDLAGENGEYHTMVVISPLFRTEVE